MFGVVLCGFIGAVAGGQVVRDSTAAAAGDQFSTCFSLSQWFVVK